MGSKPGEVTEENTECLKVLEDSWSYPPRFMFRHEYDGAENTRTEVIITFNGITSTHDGNPHIDKIILKKPGKYNVIKNV